MDAGHDFGAPARLVPEMSSRRLQVFAFVRDYILRFRGSPSHREIAAGVGISRTRVQDLVQRLVSQGLLIQRPGSRGLTLPADRDAAIATLRALGWVVDEAIGRALPGPETSLPSDFVLDYSPQSDGSGEAREHDGGGRAAGTRAGERRRTG